MPAAINITVTKSRQSATAALTGGPATTPVIFNITHGTGVEHQTITTDGTGAATVSFVPQGPNNISVSVTQTGATVTVAGPTSAVVPI